MKNINIIMGTSLRIPFLHELFISTYHYLIENNYNCTYLHSSTQVNSSLQDN